MARIFLYCLILLLPFLTGASSSQQTRRVEEEKRLQLSPEEASLQRRHTPEPKTQPKISHSLYQELLNKKTVTNAEGREMVQLLLPKGTPWPQELSFSDKELLTRGTLGRMICQILGIKGGINMHLFRTSKRYAHKELVYLGIMFQGSSREYVSGKELIVTIIQAINYITKDSS